MKLRWWLRENKKPEVPKSPSRNGSRVGRRYAVRDTSGLRHLIVPCRDLVVHGNHNGNWVDIVGSPAVLKTRGGIPHDGWSPHYDRLDDARNALNGGAR